MASAYHHGLGLGKYFYICGPIMAHGGPMLGLVMCPGQAWTNHGPWEAGLVQVWSHLFVCFGSSPRDLASCSLRAQLEHEKARKLKLIVVHILFQDQYMMMSRRRWPVSYFLFLFDGSPRNLAKKLSCIAIVAHRGPKLGPIVGPGQVWAHRGPWLAQAWANNGPWASLGCIYLN
jgi:hypothetical protein